MCIVSGLLWVWESMRKHPLAWGLTLAGISAGLILWAAGIFSHLHWSQWYHWFWHDVCKLPHHFTYYMRESALAHPYWWILTPIILGVAFFLWLWLGDPDWWANTSERKQRFGWYLGSIFLYAFYYVLVCHLWGIL